MSETDMSVTPLPVPGFGDERPALIVLFGGTFDPPHVGHAELPGRVRDELEKRLGCVGKAWLVYVPAARSPFKTTGPVATDADRVEMLRLALANTPRAAVWTDEIDRAARAGNADDPSFTVDTLRRAREWLDTNGMDGVGLRLLIGADQAVGFHKWRSPREIVQMARPAVMVRGDVDNADDLLRRMRQNHFWKREELEMWREGMVPVGRIDVSATQVRDALRSGDAAEAARWLAPGVVEYIQRRGLYGLRA